MGVGDPRDRRALFVFVNRACAGRQVRLLYSSKQNMPKRGNARFPMTTDNIICQIGGMSQPHRSHIDPSTVVGVGQRQQHHETSDQ